MVKYGSRLSTTVFFIALGLLPGARAQSTSSIQGTVTDPAGAAVVKATVSVRNTDTGEERVVTTDESGTYALPSLTPGSYRIEAKAPGFQGVVAGGLRLEVGRSVVQNFALKLSTASEVIEVSATAPVVEAGTVSVGQVIDQRTVQEIPLNGRHFVDLGLLIPGSVTPPANGFLTAPLRGQGSLAFNTAGNREDTVNFMINGINLNDMVQNQVTFQPTISTVAEFKVDNSTYNAEYGRNSGAIVNIATRAGANQYHGEVFEFLRDWAMDARNYFNKVGVPQSQFIRNQYGADGGGPVVKDKTFFFLSWEGLRQRQGVTINSGVLTPDQRTQAQAIGNPTVVKLLGLIPQPNAGAARFIGSASAPVDIDQGTANVTHVFSSADRLNGYFAYQHDLRGEPTLQGNTIPGFGDTREGKRWLLTLNETHVFNAGLVNEARLGFNRIHITFAPVAALNPADFGIANGVTSAIGLPQMTLRDISLNFGGPSGFPQGRGDTTGVLSDTLSLLRGKHSFKVGGEFRRFLNGNFGNDPGTFAFNTVNDFNNGQAASFTVNTLPTNSRIGVNALGLFVTDQYRVARRLTLDLGFRYDVNYTPTEAMNRFVVFDQATGSLLQLGSGIDQVYKTNWFFEPRVGVAYDVFGTGKTIVRSAWAMAVDQPVTNLVSPLASNPPLANPVSFNGPGTVGFSDALSAAAAAGSLAPQTINPDYTNSSVYSYNFNLQQEVSGTLGLTAGYYGSAGRHLRLGRNLNQFVNGVRPWPRLASTSPILPGAGLGNITQGDSPGNSSYNALWLTATKRFSHGLQTNTSYTWSKSIDYNSLNSSTITVQDSNNVAGDRGLSDFNAAHRFTLSGLYEFPFTSRALSKLVEGWQLSPIVQLQTGNPVNLVTTVSTLTGATTLRPDAIGPVAIGLTPAANGNPLYIQSTACTAPAAGCTFLIASHFGNLGRNVIIGPGFDDIDLSLLKNTRFRERYNVQFRADAFNLFNHPNFGQPNRTVSTAAGNTFGQITSSRFPVGDSGSSRQLQLALKFIF